MTDHSHIALLADWIKREWYWLTTSVVVVGYSLRWVWLKYMSSDFMERQEVIKRIQHVEDSFGEKLAEHERKEFKRQDFIEDEMKKNHQTLYGKIDDLTKIIIENMRAGK
jgi:hypothetical protein